MLENIVLQARDPVTTGAFWSAALGLADLTLEADLYEGRLTVGEMWLDLCIERVDEAPPPGWRLHLDLAGGQRQEEVVERLVGLGARRLDIGQGDVPWVVLADPDGNAFCVMEERPAYRDTGPIAALPLDSSDPERDAALYQAVTGWVRAEGVGPVTLRHPSLRGPLLELCPEPGPKLRQNRTHLDVRPEPGGQAELVELALANGAVRAAEPWALGHPWVVLRDTSGNELCVLP
ncbi:MAG: VOC family protein [Salana multivorans]|uniref:VOC family protein n=1 Tax=Salana multivorans TaxID=120377 RepID=UPI00095AEB3E|nr:VOC family protein [Salana multivorans]MBN8882487.1 VOC family protein [Salana multivorans]OJX98258.1 MAG: glyoxalase-like domain protein [Micrococcales bacterium 73-15]